MMTYLAKLLPRILSRKALLATATIISDRNREMIAGVLHARKVGVLHAQCVWQPCVYHNIIQALENPQNFGKAHCGSEGFSVYDNILVTLNHIGRGVVVLHPWGHTKKTYSLIYVSAKRAEPDYDDVPRQVASTNPVKKSSVGNGHNYQ